MKKSILVTSLLLLVSTLVLSSCTAKDQLETQVFNEDKTDEQLLNDLNTQDSQVDTDFKALETELQ